MNCLLVALLLVAAASASVLDESKHAPDTKDLPTLGGVTWVWATKGELPCADYVRGGDSYDAKAIFMVGRLLWKDHLLPAKVEPTNANLAYHAMSNYKMTGPLATANTYEVLCGDGVAWQPMYNVKNDTVFPSNVLAGGFFNTGEQLYICRIFYDDHVDVGYVDPQEGNVCMYAHYNGIGTAITYEVLITI